ncbi:16S rRNA (guanine(527)-N(7))-methyltransferase RsmG [Fonticella tunisiensis]|uniref:Ribosomal RNA small subunit methyltransferase G n=1 Tax=Fonticella tunisiensis TaxID=1096341 RepID=A0A4R7KA51_9CLOT|nr:16S rRNA (guanine(527)-N(7))-methyltransferase RsmG [Fonticella tunisiensis]TDT50491.1 16S rRNA m(7)G-527 methyltransferase [Fonticella tunisiensis]
MDIRDLLIDGARKYNIDIDDEKIEKLIAYKKILVEWNKRINLTSIIDDEGIAKKHFIDSMSLFKSGKIDDNSTLIDVGTGAGFPGIVVKIMNPDLKVVLLDSLNKRINFLNEVISQLGLKDIETIHGRAEDIARRDGYRESFDIATARAVANMTVLSEYCLPFVKVGGYFIAMKGPSAEEEVNMAKNAIGTLGGRYLEIINAEIPGDELEHKIVIVEKIKNTDRKYPRKAGLVEKKPIK